MIGVIDLGMNNIGSIEFAFRRLGIDLKMIRTQEDFTNITALVLPGVGAFGDAMKVLEERSLIAPIREWALDKKRIIIGICLGMQLLAEDSQEFGEHAGLGLVRGRVVKLHRGPGNDRVPNMGWCDTQVVKSGILHPSLSEKNNYYFVHSYHLVCDDEELPSSVITHGGRSVTASIEKENIFGIQFHPERSQAAGLEVLKRFFDHVMKKAS